MKQWKTLASALAVAGLIGFGGLSVGCEEEGPGEELGEAFDNASRDMRDAADDAGDRMNRNDAGERLQDAADDAGDRMENAADNAGDRLENAGQRMENAVE